jgi:hypothetical protein
MESTLPHNLGQLFDYFMIHACRCIIGTECMKIPSTERSQENKLMKNPDAVEK